MKTSSIFWGTLLIVLGLLVLINNFSPINLNWGNLWQFWPVILVLFGISMLIKNKAGKGLITGAAAVILAIIIFTSIKFSTDFVDNDFEIVFDDEGEYNFSETVYKESFDSSISKAKLFLNAGAGSFNIGSPTDEMIYVKTVGVENNFSFTTSKSDSAIKIKLNMKKTMFHFGKGKYKNKVDISLNEKPLWDLNFDIGAAAVKLDLTKYKIKYVDVNMGAASLEVKLGALTETTKFYVDAGASKIDISVPEKVGTQIKMDAVLSSKNIKGFKSLKSGLYRTEGFNEAEKKIFIDLSTGVSSINIRRYLE
jgi:LiaI-LiaF-like transmembrane region